MDHDADEMSNKKSSHQDCIDKLHHHFENKFNNSDVMNKYHIDMDDCMTKNGIADDDEHDPFKECTGLE